MQNLLFQTIKIANLALKNRFVMSAAHDNLDNNKDLQIARFSKLAKGGIGLIITGGTRINKITNWHEIISAVHSHGGKIAIQIVSETGPGKIPWLKEENDKIAVSELTPDNEYFNSDFIKYGKHHIASEQEILTIIDTYAQAALKAKAIKADAIQIHAAHQSFLSQFLSPLTNKRTDQWGGSINNRTRIHREIYKAIRKAVGEDFPILIKLGVEDSYKDGLKFSEGKIAAQLVAEVGYDAIEISQGLQNFGLLNFAMGVLDFSGTPMRTEINRITDEGYFRNWCHEIKQIIAKPTILTGGLRSLELCEQLVQNKDTDMIGMCRPFIREPELTNLWQGGDLRKASCISCNLCCKLLVEGQPLACAVKNGTTVNAEKTSLL